MAGKAGGAGALAGATPWGAGIQAATAIASTPNTSASGDITSGVKTLGSGSFGGLNFGTQIPPWAMLAGLALVAALIFLRR